MSKLEKGELERKLWALPLEQLRNILDDIKKIDEYALSRLIAEGYSELEIQDWKNEMLERQNKRVEFLNFKMMKSIDSFLENDRCVQ